jgi:hypothetical protein
MAKYVSGRHKNLKVGIASYSENLTSLEVIGNVGIATTNATSKLYVVGDTIITGVITASSFSGNATTASYATNAGVATYASVAGVATALQNSRTFEITGDIVASPISFDGSGNVSLAATIQPNSVGLGTDTTGNYVASVTNGSYITGADGGSEGSVLTIGVAATSTNTANQVVARDSSGNFSAGTITANLTGTASTASFATTAFNLSNAANITTGTIDSARLSGTYNIDISGNAATSDYADVAGIATYASTAGVATALQNSRTFEITGDIVASPISFNGTGNVSLAATIQPNSVALGGDTTGDYVQTVSGTIGQITVTGGTGEGSTPVISIASNPTLPGNVTVGNDLQVNNNLNVTGNITVGGTAGFILVENFRVSDADIVLGFTTNASNQDVSNDTTANHGGIAVASTEGNPLVNLNIAGIETLPDTYKKIMWFKAGSFAGLNTDAWLSNYAIGIGSTQFPSGTRLAAGSVQFTEQDLAVVRNINASGIITGTLANNLTLNTSGTGLSGVATYNNSGATTFTVTSNATSNNTPSTIVARDASGNFSAGTITANLIGTASTAGVATALQNSRTFEITGDIVASPISFDGTGNVSLAATIQPNSVALGSDTTGNYVASVANGSYITGADGGSEGSTLTIGVAATSANTASQVVARDASGNFSAGTITANLTGTASTASFATTAFNLSNAANITTGTINSARLTGTYNIDISGNAATATYASTAGVATYASNAGIATYASNAGIATYADSAGIATVAQNVTGSPNITVSSVNSTGIVTALSFSGSGSNLTGIVTQIIAGTNISINPTGGTGAVTVNSNAITGVLISTNTTNQSQYLIYSTSTGSTTGFGVSTSGLVFNPSSNNLGIATTNPTSKLYVVGDGYFTGVVTATTFVGNLTGTATTATNLANAANITTGTINSSRLSGTYNIDISGNSATSDYADIAGIATYASNAGIATYATSAGVSTSVIGGIASVTQLSVSGVSTLGTVQISSGIVTATSGVVTYYGDGSKLSNITSGITVQDEGSTVGTSVTTLNFSGATVSVSNAVNGISTITVTASGIVTYVDNAGIATNLKGGLTGNIPYQSAPNTTTFLANGSSGTILQSNGVGNAPSWVTAAPAGAITGITVRDEGTIVGSANSVSQLNFVGNIVSVASTAGIATVTFLDYVSNAGVATYASTAGVATALQNSRTFEITGDIVASPISFNGTGNVSLAATIQPNSVALGGDTTGNYVASVTNGSYITGGNGGSEGAALTIGVAATSLNTANQVVARDASGNFSAGTITANLTGTASTASFATTAFNLSNAANITTGTINSSRLSGTYNIDISGNAATSTYASTAGVATALQNSRTFEITGDIVASPISFNGTGNVSLAATIQPNSVALGGDTTGDYVQTVTGTANQITVTGGTGEGSTPTLSVPNQFTAPQDVTVTRDLQVDRNLNVNGNITIGGTSATIFSQSLTISDPDIVLGYRTDGSGNDISNDNTANHGGVALASTEGTPLVQLFIAGIETNPATYKKIMWFKSGTFSGLGTDAWLSNYAVGIGSTQFPTGTRLAAGSVQFTQNDLAVVRNINASGITTTNNLNVTGVGTFLSSGLKIRNPANTFEYSIVGSAIAANRNLTLPLITGTDTLAVLGLSQTFSAAQTFSSTLSASGTLDLSGSATGTHLFGSNQTSGTLTFGGTSGTGAITLGRATTSQTTNIQAGATASGNTKTINFGTGGLSGSFTQLNIGPTAGVGTVSINTGTNLGIGSATPTSKLDVVGDAKVSGVVTATSFSGNATSATYASTAGVATALQNSRTFEITGDIIASPISFNGTGNVSLAATIQPNSVALGGDTTGNYVASVTNGSYITGADGGSEGAALTIGVAATSLNTANQVVARDSSGNFSAGTITASLTGTATSTTNIPNLTGDITSNGTVTSIASGVIVNDDINASAGIVDTKLATISTAGKVLNSATTATNANTASAIVARDASGNFSAGTITANLTGTASTASFATTSYNLTDAANITTGTINSARLTGTYNIDISGNAATSTYATSAGVSTSVSGGTGSLTQLQVTGISTFTNGPVFIGAATSTGTASQPLQVTGGAYVSGNIGAAVTSPSFAVDVSGDTRVQSTGKMRFGGTAGTTNFYIQYNSSTNSLDFVAG